MMLNNIAVLIDGDNASSKNIGAILNKISEFGTITLKKIYGDWSQTNLSG
ncbi:MAG: NYN domain-containing protein [Moraxella sp.]|nr:MAG: NYN domain-containing protein [Moraxella sp.]